MNTYMVWEDASIGKAPAMQVWGWEFRSPAGQAWRLACNLSSQVAEMGSQGWLARTAKLWAPAQDMMLPHWKTADERQDTTSDLHTQMHSHLTNSAHTHANTHTYMQTQIYIHKHLYMYANTDTYMQTHIHTCKPIYTHMKTYMQIEIHTHVNKKGIFKCVPV